MAPVCLIAALVLSLIIAPTLVHAHVERGQAAGLLTGFEHPWSGLDHILAMVAVGIWGAQLGNPAIWVLPITFPVMMSIGAMLGLLSIPLPGIEIGIAVSAVMLGIMILGEFRPHLVVAMMIVGFFAIFHGHAHGTELPAGQSGLLYSLGFVVGTGCLHTIGILIGLLHRYPYGNVALRGLGAFIAVMGLVFFWQAAA